MAAEAEQEGDKGSLVARVAAGTALILSVALVAALLLGGGPSYIGAHGNTLSDMFANLGVATAAKTANPGEGQLGHYLRQFGPTGVETAAIHPKRVASNRGNAYLTPLGVLSTPEGAEYKVLPSFDCNNSGEKTPQTGAQASPGCRVQKGFPFKGTTTGRYPRLEGEDYTRP